MKFISLVLTMFLSFITLSGCGQSSNSAAQIESTTLSESTTVQTESTSKTTEEAKLDINIAALKGPTSMGIVKLIDDSENGLTANNYKFDVYAKADEIVPKIVKGELDIACVPANLASVLFNNTEGKISVGAINTLGVLYVVQTGKDVKPINSINDLRGLNIYSTGKGTTPEYVLNYILTSNGIDPEKDVKIEYKSEATEVTMSMMTSSQAQAVGILPEPYVTTALSQGLDVALNLTEEWDKVQTEQNKSSLITGVVIARNEFINENKDDFNKFLDEYKLSTDYINNNLDEGSKLVEKYGITKADIALKAIPKCNITFIEGDEMKQNLNGYLEVLYNQNPKSVGGNMPDEKFYYKR